MEAEYQQRGMPAVGVASGVGVGPGRGITGLPVPRSPQNAVQRWEQKVAEQSPPPVGSAEYSRGAALERKQLHESEKGDEAFREATASLGRSSSSSSSNSRHSESYVRSSGGSSSSNSSVAAGSEVMAGRIASRDTRQRAAAARAEVESTHLGKEVQSGISRGQDGSGTSGGQDGSSFAGRDGSDLAV